MEFIQIVFLITIVLLCGATFVVAIEFVTDAIVYRTAKHTLLGTLARIICGAFIAGLSITIALTCILSASTALV